MSGANNNKIVCVSLSDHLDGDRDADWDRAKEILYHSHSFFTPYLILVIHSFFFSYLILYIPISKRHLYVHVGLYHFTSLCLILAPSLLRGCWDAKHKNMTPKVRRDVAVTWVLSVTLCGRFCVSIS
jgi:hypothetical protein